MILAWRFVNTAASSGDKTSISMAENSPTDQIPLPGRAFAALPCSKATSVATTSRFGQFAGVASGPPSDRVVVVSQCVGNITRNRLQHGLFRQYLQRGNHDTLSPSLYLHRKNKVSAHPQSPLS